MLRISNRKLVIFSIRDDKQEAHDLGVGSLICMHGIPVPLFGYCRVPCRFYFHAVLLFYNSLFLSLLYHIQYHDMLQWGVQSIAAFGLSEKHKFYHIILGLYGQEALPLPELPPLQPVKNR
ncbi:hypothetical protein [Chryseobacterium oncorhynchi]|uniref:hypothetical protein n=1 Tax=Chryseobacterium oncorhynchi TaxID=741074 RepID=UPI000F4F4EF3|nr:hypothetical protein [Chryseobacterium oncorhynchi]